MGKSSINLLKFGEYTISNETLDRITNLIKKSQELVKKDSRSTESPFAGSKTELQSPIPTQFKEDLPPAPTTTAKSANEVIIGGNTYSVEQNLGSHRITTQHDGNSLTVTIEEGKLVGTICMKGGFPDDKFPPGSPKLGDFLNAAKKAGVEVKPTALKDASELEKKSAEPTHPPTKDFYTPVIRKSGRLSPTAALGHTSSSEIQVTAQTTSASGPEKAAEEKRLEYVTVDHGSLYQNVVGTEQEFVKRENTNGEKTFYAEVVHQQRTPGTKHPNPQHENLIEALGSVVSALHPPRKTEKAIPTPPQEPPPKRPGGKVTNLMQP